MSEFLGLLNQFKDNNKEFVAEIKGGKIIVKIQNIAGDAVTLYEQGNDNRYDLHYTQVVIRGLRS